jgi:hypothetical protein
MRMALSLNDKWVGQYKLMKVSIPKARFWGDLIQNHVLNRILISAEVVNIITLVLVADNLWDLKL